MRSFKITIKFIKSLILMVSVLLCLPLMAQEYAKDLFSHLSPTLYQIRIVDVSSGQKSSIGTGFQISADGLIATNYHVVSQKALNPDNYFIEYQDNNGNKGKLDLLSVDVINDLALVKRQTSVTLPFLSIAKQDPDKGVEVFSLGNPHDLGMIISPGIYNGIKKDSFYNRVHFTGSINSGMSGGPVVNKDEEVVGVNVASSGNSIGFLVPRKALQTLVDGVGDTSSIDIKSQIRDSLLANQQHLSNQMLSKPWSVLELGEAAVAIELVDAMRCWGNSNADDKEAIYKAASTFCQMEEDIYISDSFTTGFVTLRYHWYDASEINSTRFYNLYQNSFRGASADNKAGKDDVGQFICQDDIVINDKGLTHKVAFCARAYKEYQGLFDVIYVSASLDKEHNGLLSNLTLSGINKENALKVTRQFIQSIGWKE